MIDSECTETNTSEIYDKNVINNNEPPKVYTHTEKKLLVKRIEDIKIKKCYIFKIIHADDFKYIKKENGIFFNLTELPDEILNKIDNIVKYYENKKNNIEFANKSMTEKQKT